MSYTDLSTIINYKMIKLIYNKNFKKVFYWKVFLFLFLGIETVYLQFL